MKGPLRVHYDEEGDFLEISVGAPRPCIATEVQPGVFVRKDEQTDEVKSIGILDFKKRAHNLNDIELFLPVEISLSAAVEA